MSTQEQITKLQGLLERIQRNASRARNNGVPLPPPAAFAPPPAMPAAFAPPPAAPPPAFAAPPPAALDQSVDDLLGASPMPAEVDVALDSIPPVEEIAASPSQAPDAEPIPLVSVANEPLPPPIDDAFGLDSEVSEVRVTTATREPAAEVTVAAIEAEAEPIATEELSEDDLVEVTEGTPPPAATDVDIDFDDEEEEQPPASSQRQVASSMDEALAAAAAQEADREVPLKTPPPESGPQEAPIPTGMAAPAAPDVDALLGGELDIPTREVAAAPGPTTEQLGQTIDLEEARGPSLELAEHQAAAPSAAQVEELEMPLPARDAVGGYDDNLQPPPDALNDLEAHRRRLEDDIPPPPESLATLPSVQPGAYGAEIVPLQAAPEAAAVGPEIIARPAPVGSPETFSSVRDTFRPSSFVELLDASLSL
jgi:hypothetical protein